MASLNHLTIGPEANFLQYFIAVGGQEVPNFVEVVLLSVNLSGVVGGDIAAKLLRNIL